MVRLSIAISLTQLLKMDIMDFCSNKFLAPAHQRNGILPESATRCGSLLWNTYNNGFGTFWLYSRKFREQCFQKFYENQCRRKCALCSLCCLSTHRFGWNSQSEKRYSSAYGSIIFFLHTFGFYKPLKHGNLLEHSRHISKFEMNFSAHVTNWKISWDYFLFH